MEHTFTLTKKQAHKLDTFVDCFLSSAKSCNPFPPTMLLLISGIHSAILEGKGLEQHHIDILIWMMDLVFDQMGDDDFDPLLEQVYHKLTGYWPTETPWFERIKHVKL